MRELAERQWGVVSRRQLEGLGLSPGVITRWVEDGRLHRVHPRVFALGHGCLAVEGRLAAALFYAGPQPALYGMTAAAWLGIVAGVPRLIHVASPRRRRSVPGVRLHHRKYLERILHKRLPVTPPARTLLDIASRLRTQQLRRALAEAEFLKLVTLDEVEAVLGPGKPGAAALRTALECHRPALARTKSPLEERLIYMCEHHALPIPDVNVWVAGHEVDAVWWDAQVAVELDSHLAHGTPSRLESDHRRDLDLRAAGFAVLRYTWRQLCDEPAHVVADLRRQGIS